VRDETARRPLVQRLRRSDLEYFAVVEDRDPVRHRERFLLVVGHVHRGDAEILLQLADLGAHLQAHFRVEVGERLIEQEDLGIQHQSAGERHALLLPARELPRVALAEAAQPQIVQHLHNAGVDPGRCDLPQLEPVADVLLHRHVRPQGVVLEHHADAALIRRHIVHDAISEADCSVVGSVEARDQPEQRGLPAPRRTEEREQLTLLDGKTDGIDRRLGAEALGDAFDRNAHGSGPERRIDVTSSIGPRPPRCPCGTAG
jgi:hypothetical protein